MPEYSQTRLAKAGRRWSTQGNRVLVVPVEAGIQSRWTYLFRSPKPVRMALATSLDARLLGHDDENAIALVVNPPAARAVSAYK